MPIAYCLLPLAFPSWEGLGVGLACLLPIAYCLLPIAYCLLPIASCLLPLASCLSLIQSILIWV
ncbi:MAG: hypothetical protein F6K56_04845 [Moorea sp. SIO3G5]|nr:hypothetical protein [Moorena sp. SIO3G5]